MNNIILNEAHLMSE